MDPSPSNGYPDDNPKTVYGNAKPGMKAVPPSALIELGRVMSNGASKYGLMNWREHTVSSSVYYDAALRHLFRWYDGEDMDDESGLPHLAHAMACIAILIDAMNINKLNDDRPISGGVSSMIKEYTTHV